MNLYFVFNGKYNKDVIRSFKKYILPPGLIHVFKAAFIIAGIMIVFSLITKDILFTVIFVFGLLFLYMEKYVISNYLINKISTMLIKEEYPELIFNLKFYDDYIRLSRVDEIDGTDFNYSRVTRIAETSEYLFLIFKENMCFPILNVIDIDEKDAWLDFMLEKNKKIKLQNVI